MALPPQAVIKDGKLTIELTEDDLVYITENVMPDVLGIDPTVEGIKVMDKALHMKNVVEALNNDSRDEQGWTYVYRMLESAISDIFENGEEGVEFVPVTPEPPEGDNWKPFTEELPKGVVLDVKITEESIVKFKGNFLDSGWHSSRLTSVVENGRTLGMLIHEPSLLRFEAWRVSDKQPVIMEDFF